MGFDLSSRDWVSYIPIATSVGLAAYVVWQAMSPKVGLCNPDIQKEDKKVVNSMDVEDIGDKIAFCRCWRSKKFPLCDGAHGPHNKKTGDNVGPMVVTRKSS